MTRDVIASPASPTAAEPGQLPERARRSTLVAGVLLAALAVLTYAPVVYHTYAFSDDYNLLVWGRTGEWGRVLQLALSNGRPFHILPQMVLYRALETIDGLAVMRALSLGGAVIFSVLLFTVLRRTARFRLEHAALLAALALLLPSSQIIVAWGPLFTLWWAGICALLAISLLFKWNDEAIPTTCARTRVLRVASIVLLLVLGLQNYQPFTMVFFGMLGLVYLGRSGIAGVTEPAAPVIRPAMRPYLLGLGHAVVAMGIAFCLIRLYPHQVPRARLEDDWLGKAHYFVQQPLATAISLFALQPIQWWGILNVAVVAAFGLIQVVRQRIPLAGVALLFALLPLTHLPLLVTAADFSPRRATFALSFYVLAIAYVAWAHLAYAAGRAARLPDRAMRIGTFAAVPLLVLPPALLARSHVVDLFIRPQQVEFAFVRERLKELNVRPGDKVYVRRMGDGSYPWPVDKLMEFGSPSSSHDWAVWCLIRLAAEVNWDEAGTARGWVAVEYGYGDAPEGWQRRVLLMDDIKQYWAERQTPPPEVR